VGQRRKTEKAVYRNKVWSGMGPWSPEVATFLKKKVFFFGPQSGGCGPMSWGHVAPSCCHHCHGAGNPQGMAMGNIRGSGCQVIVYLVPGAQASLAFPLAVELPCLCAPSFSQLRHWEPFSRKLPCQAGGLSVHMCTCACWSPFCML
jgi:hypothetical protein